MTMTLATTTKRSYKISAERNNNNNNNNNNNKDADEERTVVFITNNHNNISSSSDSENQNPNATTTTTTTTTTRQETSPTAPLSSSFTTLPTTPQEFIRLFNLPILLGIFALMMTTLIPLIIYPIYPHVSFFLWMFGLSFGFIVLIGSSTKRTTKSKRRGGCCWWKPTTKQSRTRKFETSFDKIVHDIMAQVEGPAPTAGKNSKNINRNNLGSNSNNNNDDGECTAPLEELLLEPCVPADGQYHVQDICHELGDKKTGIVDFRGSQMDCTFSLKFHPNTTHGRGGGGGWSISGTCTCTCTSTLSSSSNDSCSTHLLATSPPLVPATKTTTTTSPANTTFFVISKGFVQTQQSRQQAHGTYRMYMLLEARSTHSSSTSPPSPLSTSLDPTSATTTTNTTFSSPQHVQHPQWRKVILGDLCVPAKSLSGEWLSSDGRRGILQHPPGPEPEGVYVSFI